MWWIYPVYLVDLAVMIFLSFQLANLVDLLDKKTKISGAFIGGVLLAAVTSLPELFTAFSSILLVHNASYVVGDVLGSIIFDLVVLALETFIFVKHFKDSKFDKWHIVNVIFCLAMYLLAAYAFFAPGGAIWNGGGQVMLGDINLISILIFVLYIITLIVQPKDSAKDLEGFDEKDLDGKKELGADWTLRKIVILFAVCSVTLIASSIALTYLTDLIKEDIPLLSGSAAGALLLGIGTSVPEVVSTARLFRKKNYDAGFGNMIGSCTFDMGILAFSDFISWHQIHPNLGNVTERGIYIPEPDALQFEYFGIAVCVLTIIFCALRFGTKIFQKKPKVGYAIAGAYAALCLAAYLLIFII